VFSFVRRDISRRRRSSSTMSGMKTNIMPAATMMMNKYSTGTLDICLVSIRMVTVV